LKEMPIDSAKIVPDPSSLTLQRIAESVGALSEKLDYRILAIEKAVEVSHSDLVRVPTAVDRAVLQLRELLETRIHCDAEQGAMARDAITKHVNTALEQLNSLSASRNKGVEDRIDALTEALAVFKETVNGRFELGDVQTEKAARDVKSAVDAAFAAAKEAVGEQNKSNALSIAKSEVATTKQIDQLTENLRLSVKNTDDKIEAMKKTSDDKFTDIKDRLVAMEGRSRGIGATGAVIVGAFSVVGVLVGMAAIILHFSH
jgi:hypothetical protein